MAPVIPPITGTVTGGGQVVVVGAAVVGGRVVGGVVGTVATGCVVGGAVVGVVAVGGLVVGVTAVGVVVALGRVVGGVVATAVVGAVVAGDCVPPAGVLAGAVVVGSAECREHRPAMAPLGPQSSPGRGNWSPGRIRTRRRRSARRRPRPGARPWPPVARRTRSIPWFPRWWRSMCPGPLMRRRWPGCCRRGCCQRRRRRGCRTRRRRGSAGPGCRPWAPRRP